MKVALILSLAIAVALAAPAEEIAPAIIGGVNALAGEFPFVVSIQWVLLGISSHVCGGVILNNIWVLSAAHCFDDVSNRGSLQIWAGKINLGITEPGQIVIGINRAASITHPGWISGASGPDDLVLVRLISPLTFSNTIRAARLPQANVVPTGTGRLSGWGATGTGIGGGGTVNLLQKATLPKIDIGVCRNAFFASGMDGDLITDNHFCTGPLTGGLSACAGDFGGPIVQGDAPNEVVTGILSWAVAPCGTVGSPSGVYKQVSSFVPWITANTGITP